MKNTLSLIALTSLMAALVSCFGVDNDDPAPSNPTIYVAGVEYDEQDRAYPIVWKDGTAQRLTTNGNDSGSAESIFLSGDTQYVAGHVNDSARLWRNGESQILNSAVSHARSVTVVNSNVYVAGESDFGAALWSNGIRMHLSNQGEANSVHVSGNEVYVGGTDDQGRAVIWRNWAFFQTLTGGYTVLSVYVSGSDVWAAGFDGDREWGCSARLWKNGDRQNLSVGNGKSQACSVAVSGNNVYVAGYDENSQGKYVAKLWKNDTVQDLSSGSYDAKAMSVFIFRNDVYVTGHEYNAQGKAQATIWKNGSVFQRLTNGNSDTYANSIFVK